MNPFVGSRCGRAASPMGSFSFSSCRDSPVGYHLRSSMDAWIEFTNEMMSFWSVLVWLTLTGLITCLDCLERVGLDRRRFLRRGNFLQHRARSRLCRGNLPGSRRESRSRTGMLLKCRLCKGGPWLSPFPQTLVHIVEQRLPLSSCSRDRKHLLWCQMRVQAERRACLVPASRSCRRKGQTD